MSDKSENNNLQQEQQAPSLSKETVSKSKKKNRRPRPKRKKVASQVTESAVLEQEQKKKKEDHKRISVASFLTMQHNQQTDSKSVKKTPKPENTPKQLTRSNSKTYTNIIPASVLDELEFRFISNIPQGDRNQIRYCFQVELAHWFYIDFIVGNEEHPDCRPVQMKNFLGCMIHHCKDLKHLRNKVDEVMANWREYKSTVPTYGAILLDESLKHVLLVQSYFSKGNSWGFPKGKVNQKEDPRNCAIRETYEETGFDFSTISKKEEMVQMFLNDTMVRLYIVPNVPKDYQFSPQTRKEIRNIQWFNIWDLPNEKGGYQADHLKNFNFYNVFPFVNRIRRYATKRLEARATKSLSKLTPFKQVPTSTNMTPNPKMAPILSQLFNTPSSSTKLPEEDVSRPTLPDIRPTVGGFDVLSTLGICTPLKPGASLNEFPQTFKNPCETIKEKEEEPRVESKARRAILQDDNEKGFEMPVDLSQPLVTSHPWQNPRKSADCTTPTANLYSTESGSKTQTPTSRNLNHLISTPIQPQPIVPIRASASEIGSAEAPKKSSRISLSDKSAFKVIVNKQSPAMILERDSQSRTSTVTPQRVSQYESLGDISTLSESMNELYIIDKNQAEQGAQRLPIPLCKQWTLPIQLDLNYIMGAHDSWNTTFNVKA